MMFCNSIRSLIHAFIAAFNNGKLPPVPTGLNDFHELHRDETLIAWDLDPKVKHAGERFVDQVAWNFLPKDILPPDAMDDIQCNGTRSNFVEADRHKPLIAAIETGYVAWDNPPAPITEAMLVELAREAVEVFGLRCPAAKLTPYDMTSWPPNHGAGLSYCGTKQEEYPRAKQRCMKMLDHIAAHGLDSMSYPRYAGISRTQLATITKSKTRLIWFVAFHLLLMQLRLFTVIITAFQACTSKPAIGGLTLEEATKKFDQHFHLEHDDDDSVVYFNIDYPAFDCGKSYEDEDGHEHYAAGMQPWEYRWLTLVIMFAYAPDDGSKWDYNVLFFIIVFAHSAINKRIQIGAWLYKVRGMMASGDGFTYFCDTLIGWLRFRIICMLMNIPKTKALYYGGGDDGIVAMSLRHYNRDRINQLVRALFRSNWKLPPEAEVSNVRAEIKFHGRYWLQAQWYRPLEIVVSLLLFRENSDLLFNPPLYRERGRADAALSLQRVLSIYEDSGRRYSFLLKMAAEIQDMFPGMQPRTTPDREFYSLFGVYE